MNDFVWCPLRDSFMALGSCGRHQERHRSQCERISCDELDRDGAVYAWRDYQKRKDLVELEDKA